MLTATQIDKRVEDDRLAIFKEAYFDSVTKVAETSVALHYPPHPDDPPKREFARRCESCVGDALTAENIYEYPVTGKIKLYLCKDCYDELTDLN